MTPKANESSTKANQAAVFRCQLCGDCCSGRGGIFVKTEEVEEMAALLSLSAEDFCRRYVEVSAMGPRLSVADNGFCVFLLEGNLCQVHAVKPFICRQWPFLPALLLDGDELEHAKTACPGINPTCSLQEFVEEALRHGRENSR